MTGMQAWAPRALMIGLSAAVAAVAPAVAQAPTPEGTVISNTATVSYTDSNGNAYADVSASVDVTVGFQAGVQVTGGVAATPEPGTSGSLAFTVDNIGNGTDQFQVAVTNSDPSVIDVTGYEYDGTTHLTLDALNTALAAADVPAQSGITVTVHYDVPEGTGGETATYQLEASSVRDAGVGDASDSGTSTVSPNLTLGVAVTPDGLGADVEQLPSNGNIYSYTFRVTNNGSGSSTFDLSAPGGTVLSVSAIEVDGAGAAAVTLDADQSKDVIVRYTVEDGAAGAREDLTLTATAQSDGSITDDGHITVARIKAELAIAKRALDGARNGDIVEILPGQFIEYEVTVTNNGSSDAESVSVTDELNADYVSYVSSEDPAGVWDAITTSTNGSGNTVVTASLADPLAPSASATFYIRVQVR